MKVWLHGRWRTADGLSPANWSVEGIYTARHRATDAAVKGDFVCSIELNTHYATDTILDTEYITEEEEE